MGVVSSLLKLVGKDVKMTMGGAVYEGKVVDVFVDNYYIFIQLDNGGMYNCKFIEVIELSE